MKTKGRLLLMAFLLLAAGTMTLQAQVRYGRGTRACVNYSSLNEEQKARLDQLRTEHIARMDAMRTERGKMVIEHRAEVDKLLKDAGVTVTRPGRGSGMVGAGRGAGRCCPQAAGMGHGRGMRRFR